uniref:Uncharacterized protein n=1 Tax=Arundo donax TaxID=35708 RepID=A0A0A9CJK5_ARUDO
MAADSSASLLTWAPPLPCPAPQSLATACGRRRGWQANALARSAAAALRRLTKASGERVACWRGSRTCSTTHRPREGAATLGAVGSRRLAPGGYDARRRRGLPRKISGRTASPLLLPVLPLPRRLVPRSGSPPLQPACHNPHATRSCLLGPLACEFSPVACCPMRVVACDSGVAAASRSPCTCAQTSGGGEVRSRHRVAREVRQRAAVTATGSAGTEQGNSSVAAWLVVCSPLPPSR